MPIAQIKRLRRAERKLQPFFCRGDRLSKRDASRKLRCDGGRQRAAGAMRMTRFDAFAIKARDATGLNQYIDRRAIKIAALQ